MTADIAAADITRFSARANRRAGEGVVNAVGHHSFKCNSLPVRIVTRGGFRCSIQSGAPGMRRQIERWVAQKAADSDLLLEGGVSRFAWRLLPGIVLVADILDVDVHMILSWLGLLPYPLSEALLVGLIATSVVSLAVGYLFCYFIGSAIRSLAINRNEFEKLSLMDPLSGLMNRRAFFTSLQKQNHPGALLLVDIDRFKGVNDHFGHLAGDDVIAGISALLREAFASETADIARLGGEEFAVFLAGFNGARGFNIANQARALIALSPMQTRGGPIAVTVSIGVAELHPNRPVEEAFRRCDEALYMAKNGGRNRVVGDGEVATLVPDAPPISDITASTLVATNASHGRHGRQLIKPN